MEIFIICAVVINLLLGLGVVWIFKKKLKEIKDRFELSDNKIRVIEELRKQEILEFFTRRDLLKEIINSAKKDCEVYFFVPGPLDLSGDYNKMIRALIEKSCRIRYFDYNDEGSKVDTVVKGLQQQFSVDNNLIERIPLKKEANILPTHYCFIRYQMGANPEPIPSIIYSTIVDANTTIFGYRLSDDSEKQELWLNLEKHIIKRRNNGA